MTTYHQLWPAAASFLICLAATPVVRLVAIRRKWVAVPREDRWHKRPTALFGGIAIFLGIAVPLLAIGDFQSLWTKIHANPPFGRLPDLAAVMLVGAALLFILGLIDDVLTIKPHNKLIGQIIVASMVVFLGFRLNWFVSMTLDTMVTLVWIVGITNAFNLLDNMDGLCAGVALVAAMCMAGLYAEFHTAAFAAALAVAGSCAAFLIFNFNPASIFMGDCGSLVIGFTMAVLSLVHGEFADGSRLSAIAVPLLMLLVPLLDTTLVTVIRVLSGRKASTGGRDHTSHRLVLMGFSEKRAVLSLCGIGAVAGLAGIVVSKGDSLTSPAVIVPVAMAILLMGIYLAQLRVYPEKEFSVLRGRKFTPVLIELTYKKQILLVVLDFGIVAFAYYLAYRLRFGGAEFNYYFKVFLKSLPIIIAVKMIVFYYTGIYRGFWQYISTRDVYVYIRSSVFATLLSITCVTAIYRFKDFSLGVFVIDCGLTTCVLLGTRWSFRLFKDTIKRKTLVGDRVLIYGAGQGGELLVREILNNPSLHIQPIGFLDDDPLKIGKRIQGFPILGGVDRLPDLVRFHGIQGILIAFNGRIHPDAYDRIIAAGGRSGLFIKQFSVKLEPVDSPNLEPASVHADATLESQGSSPTG